ncbi:MAG: hypothetical protein WCK59_04495 [Candidatus Falkowbacteria bacterium]
MRISDLELQKLTVAMEGKNLSFSQVLELIENSDLQSEKIIVVASEIELTVDYGRTLEQAIADGNYDWNHGDISSENFPISPEMLGQKVEIKTKLFRFNRDISSNDVISEMDKAGYRPATLMELLALGILFPELQRQFPIVALGYVWHWARVGRFVPFLYVNDYKRGLNLSFVAGDWGTRYRFLGVRK